MTRTTRRAAVAAVVAVVVLVTGALTVALVAGGDPDDSGGRGEAAEPTASAGSTEAGSVPSGTADAASDPRLAALPDGVLLPNMRSLRAFDLRVERSGGRRLLRFAAALGNVGAGPMLVTPRGRSTCPRGQIFTLQRLHVDADGDARFTREVDRRLASRRAACMLDHPTHDHWHFDAMASYALRRPGATQPVAIRRKVSFCLRDNERVPGTRGAAPRAYYGECGATSPQGISPGWADIYGADLDGQSLPLRRGLAGVFCLDLTADPRDRLVESDETDNATSARVVVRGTRVRRLPGTCP